MIPKIIHYCWLSGEPYPVLVEKCISSWKKNLPEYDFVLWDANRVDTISNLWLKQAYENKKYAFAADYIRFYALYYYGGIYLDADVEVLKTFNDLLDQKQFLGEEAGGDIEAAVIGAEKGSSWVKECLDYYRDRPFIKSNGRLDTRPVPLLINSVVGGKGLAIKPYYYFSPKDYNIGKIDIKESTYCIHHFDGKWLKRGLKYSVKKNIHKALYLIMGRVKHNKVIRIIRIIKDRFI